MPTERPRLALVHDYLTQRGGAERVVAVMCEAFPDAELLTSLYDPSGTFPSFRDVTVRTGALQRLGLLRRHHRAALPLLAPWFSAQRVDAEVTLASSSGWAHEVRATGRLVVYCHAPARWLYQRARYLDERGTGPRAALARAGLSMLAGPLRAVDRHAAHRADRYLANSTATAAAVRAAYGIDAEVLHPPPGLEPDGPELAVPDLEDGFVLCVSRLLAYKRVDLVLDATAALGSVRVVVVGEGPERGALEARAPRTARFLGSVDDATLRWLYRHASVLVAAGFEDFGLAPLEAAGLGTPTVARRFGGFLDTIDDGVTGLLVDDPSPASLADAITAVRAHPPSAEKLTAQAASFSKDRFVARLREVAAEMQRP